MNISNIGTVYGTLLNFKGAYDALESKMHEDPYKSPPKAPIFYIKPNNTFASHGDIIEKPDQDNDTLIMGGTVGIVIGKTATRVANQEAMDFVTGFVVANDVSIAHDNFFRPAYPKRARDGFLPIGDFKNLAEIKNPDQLEIQTHINNKLVQTSSLKDLIRNISQLIQDATEFMTLSKGDILLIGTDKDAPQANIGDTVKIVIPTIGQLENTIGGAQS